MPAGPVQQKLPDAVSSAVVVTTNTESPHWLVLTSSQTVVLPMAQPKSARSVAPKVISQAPASNQPHNAAHSQGQAELMGSISPLLHNCGKAFVLQSSVADILYTCIVSASTYYIHQQPSLLQYPALPAVWRYVVPQYMTSLLCVQLHVTLLLLDAANRKSM